MTKTEAIGKETTPNTDSRLSSNCVCLEFNCREIRLFARLFGIEKGRTMEKRDFPLRIEEVPAHVHLGLIVPDVLTRQHEHRSGLIWSGDHETCFTDLQCRCFGRNLFQSYSTASYSGVSLSRACDASFALAQHIPNACDTRLDLHRTQLRGNDHTYWRTQHASHVEVWHQWRLRIRDGPVLAVESPHHPGIGRSSFHARLAPRTRSSSFQAPPPPYTVGSSTQHMPISTTSSSDSEEHDDEPTNVVTPVQQLGFGHRVGKKTTRFTPSDWP
ncbi:hypothetical protein M9H77_02476 [Catharanthus roseus]|uniref:Uncharacterized protein n=1 Tax=Catharanthus roseus TaxID=4058 RepID=A0ACC0C8M0_CATRO|nr:hypothetical protein M9H77_02476 [Catharanthus roseus]